MLVLNILKNISYIPFIYRIDIYQRILIQTKIIQQEETPILHLSSFPRPSSYCVGVFVLPHLNFSPVLATSLHMNHALYTPLQYDII